VLKDILHAETSDLSVPISISIAETELAARMNPLIEVGVNKARDGIGANAITQTRQRRMHQEKCSKTLAKKIVKMSATTFGETASQQQSPAPSAAVDMAYFAA
jgi:hypothetical protein